MLPRAGAAMLIGAQPAGQARGGAVGGGVGDGSSRRRNDQPLADVESARPGQPVGQHDVDHRDPVASSNRWQRLPGAHQMGFAGLAGRRRNHQLRAGGQVQVAQIVGFHQLRQREAVARGDADGGLALLNDVRLGLARVLRHSQQRQEEQQATGHSQQSCSHPTLVPGVCHLRLLPVLSSGPIGGQLGYQSTMLGGQFIGALGRASLSRHVEEGPVRIRPRQHPLLLARGKP